MFGLIHLAALNFVLCRLRDDHRAVTALEYGLIASLVAVFIIAAVSLLGTGLSSTFATISAKL